ncbi:hypothetical protein ACFWA5_50265 [Streptomyces mirabilis]
MPLFQTEYRTRQRLDRGDSAVSSSAPRMALKELARAKAQS